MSLRWLLLSATIGCFMVSCRKEPLAPAPPVTEEILNLVAKEEIYTEEMFLAELPGMEAREQELEMLRQQILSEVTTDQLSINGNLLVFESLEYYQSIVDHGEDMSEALEGDPILVELDGVAERVVIDYVEANGFPSYGSIHGESSEFDQEFMDAILNEDRIVQIGSWLIKIDRNDEKVWTVPATNADAYQGLLQESGEGVESHSTGDDVLYQLTNDGLARDRGCGGISSGLYPQENKVFIPLQTTLNTFVTYRRFGIYFDLHAGAGYRNYFPPTNNNIHLTLQIKGPEAWRKRRPCRSRHIGRSASGDKRMGFGNTDYSWKFYSGSRGLNGFHLFARARAVILNHPSLGFVYGFSDWRGRNINSPY
ncbi:MAG: hypothetical protein AAFW73_13795 [Bacteroidota bacterium]